MTSANPPNLETTTIGGVTDVPRLISGLWQLAGGHDTNVNVDDAAKCMDPLIDFHGLSPRNITALTKWCPPENGVKSFAQAKAAVDLACQRMGQEEIALMQCSSASPIEQLDAKNLSTKRYHHARLTPRQRDMADHIWDYTDDTYWHNLCHLRTLQQQGRIRHVGLTNVDAAHLELILDSGFAIATNQLSCSVLDRRLVRGRLARLCAERGVGVLAYGALLGGFVSERWLGRPEPGDDGPADGDGGSMNWSLRKYLRFIRAAGGWTAFQGVLGALAGVARKHDVAIAAVALRYVLDIPAVSAVIVGCRLSRDSAEHARRNLAVFALRLDEEDYAAIRAAQEALEDVPGDCGDEYRRRPYLTATGDLSQHLATSRREQIQKAVSAKCRIEYTSGSEWEPIAGYCRAVRTGNYVHVSGTTANSPIPAILPVLGGVSARSQTVAIFDIIGRALKALGASLSDIVHTRVMIRNELDCEDVSRAHGWVFKCEGIRPTNTLTVSGLIGREKLVEIEVEAELGFSDVTQV
ncbi:NADP-dependent oxidoreductase domain-containing protein [Xylariaceae sp. FL0016]|nr:NADP-dependent oxidoreductase domain-containing protein [Xylariaceae sp. FL0016]